MRQESLPLAYKHTSHSELVEITGLFIVMHLSMLCRRGGGRAWGEDLIVFVGPGVGHLTDLVLPGEGIFQSFFARRGDI